MQDEPGPADILTAIAAFLRASVVPHANPHIAFQARVAANAIDLVARQITLAASGEAAELARLRALLGRDGTLIELNAALAEGLADYTIAQDAPGLAGHLWATTAAKLAVDQPGYSGLRDAEAIIARYATNVEPSNGF